MAWIAHTGNIRRRFVTEEVVSMNDLAVISREFDKSFSRAVHCGFEQLRSSLARTQLIC